MKKYSNLVSNNKDIFPFPSKETWGPETAFSENTAFFEKTAK